MKILIRSNKSKEWNVADPIKARAEAELQRLLVESPSLIPINEIREDPTQLVLAVPEFGLPGSGSTDILAFGPGGEIAIVECKLAANPESKRKVIGQILEYAAYLWEMTYEEVDARVRNKLGNSLANLVEEAVAGEWNEEYFRDGVKNSLSNGIFMLIILVDEINEELRRIIRYINESSETVFSFHALEIKRFHSQGIEVLVPHLHGTTIKEPSVSKRKQWTAEDFQQALVKNVDAQTANLINDIHEWSAINADRIWYGTGTDTGSFTFHYLRDGKTVSVFSIYTNGRMMLNYGWLSRQVSDATIKAFHNKIISIGTFKNITSDFTKWPAMKVYDALHKPEYLEKFKDTVLWLKNEIR